MTVYILKDITAISYEGDYTEILGVFSSIEKIEERIRTELAGNGTRSYSINTTLVNGIPIPNKHRYIYYRSHSESHEFEVEVFEVE